MGSSVLDNFWVHVWPFLFRNHWTSGFIVEFGGDFNLTSFFLFQTMFCGTTTTVFSGAVMERMQFSSYPLFGHWAWNGVESRNLSGWLGAAGFIDFAGFTVVHSVGGWVAMATLLVVCPRKGRFSPNGTQVEITGSNLPLSVLGTLLLWIGWIGFNGGSTLVLDKSVPGIIVNTVMAGAAGAAFSLFVGYLYNRISKVSYLINGSPVYLKRFPLDYLKMDKSFVDEIDAAHENMEIASAIITLAHNLNLEVISEGIERMGQLETLRDMNCDYIQGYLYSRRWMRLRRWR
jgi:ammonia channel protein AmtB